jgi:hypothetical protein
LSAFKLDDSTVVLHAVTVLDVVEEIAVGDVPEEAEETDRAYWEKRRDQASMSVMDKIVQALKTPEIEPLTRPKKWP